MAIIHIGSVGDPFRDEAAVRRALAVLSRAEAMGLLPADFAVERLDWPTMEKVLKAVAAAGIGRDALAHLRRPRGATGGARVAAVLADVETALEDSPSPKHEWAAMEEVFGLERLAEMVEVSPVSARRYRAGQRPTPDDVAARLHFLAQVVGDLAGAYNAAGIRRWWERPRTALEGRAPAATLRRGWKPDDPAPRRVRELARALTSFSAT